MMFAHTVQERWTPVETQSWSRRAYGRDVMFETEGGTLKCVLDQDHAAGHVYLQGTVSGRMLIEAYCNGVQVLDLLVSNEELDCFIELPRPKGFDPLEIELHFIPATFGQARISREVAFVTQQQMVAAPTSNAPRKTEVA